MRRLAPVVRLHPEDDYRPASAEWYLSRVSLFNGNGANNSKILANVGTAQSLVSQISGANYGPGGARTDWSLVVDGNNAYQCTAFNPCSATQAMINTYAGEPIVGGQSESDAYVHITAHDASRYTLRYWFFYPYNGGLGFSSSWRSTPLTDSSGFGAHEGDWESVAAHVTVSGAMITVHSVTYEQHSDSVEIISAVNRHVPLDALTPITVYSAWHSHASYPSPGTKTRVGGLANDYASDSGPRWYTGQHLKQITGGSPAWVSYPGRWGTNWRVDNLAGYLFDEAASIRVEGPTGPAFKGSWISESYILDFFFSISEPTNQDSLKGDLTNLIPGDYNGDGRTDFIRQEKGFWDDDGIYTAQVFLSNGDGTFVIEEPDNQDSLKGDLTNLVPGDYNGDRKTDFIRQEKGPWDDDSIYTAQLFISDAQ